MGDILRGSKRRKDKAYHPIIFLRIRNHYSFEGGMITHSSDYGNIRLDDSHFDANINPDPRPNYFVPSKLIKKTEWGPFVKIGRLSSEGIEFVLSHLEHTPARFWIEFQKDTQQLK